MFYCPYAHRYNNWNYRVNGTNSYFRIFNASPNVGPIDVYVNDSPTVMNLAYKEMSEYIIVLSGNYNIKIYPAGQTTSPIINTSLPIPKDSIFTVALIGMPPSISLYPIPEPLRSENFGVPCIRFVNLSPNSPAMDVTLPAGRELFSDVNYKDFTLYACVPAGTYNIQLRPSGTNDIVSTVRGVTLDANKFYTIYAVGLFGETPPLEAMVIVEPR
ncbi:DUF4397 domain-containing protein [Clostridium sp. MSJ-11]|uniref:DUF4397 domain-containing protein n=1 Tax=Clostridium mobile TaxID=2841512 RepID=A0ABS6EFS7_9CLOT|nr:DUF4397 domain-containing protein [Clostridium mobile]MBU5484049.1 DUF4397 domain-containing protein [Clostridium mobile]